MIRALCFAVAICTTAIADEGPKAVATKFVLDKTATEIAKQTRAAEDAHDRAIARLAQAKSAKINSSIRGIVKPNLESTEPVVVESKKAKDEFVAKCQAMADARKDAMRNQTEKWKEAMPHINTNAVKIGQGGQLSEWAEVVRVVDKNTAVLRIDIVVAGPDRLGNVKFGDYDFVSIGMSTAGLADMQRVKIAGIPFAFTGTEKIGGRTYHKFELLDIKESDFFGKDKAKE